MKLPPNRPRITREEVLEKTGEWDFDEYPILIVGFRGYYENSMGKPGQNDLGIYDDACCVLTKDTYQTFNFNTDPSALAEGRAMLAPGIHKAHKLGLHKNQYLALVQRIAKVPVLRFIKGKFQPKLHWGFFGINIHKGGNKTTGSLGCQTVPPSQWQEFIELVQSHQKEVGREDGLIVYYLKEY